MTCWAIIPVKSAEQAKLRLAGALSDQRRIALVRLMQSHVFSTVAGASHIGKCCVVGTAEAQVPEGTVQIADPGQGLNVAVSAGLSEALCQGADRAVVIHADLPLLSVNDIELLCLPPSGSIAIAADRHGTGTNALSLPLPAAGGFTFAFGPDSFARHLSEAERLGLAVEMIHSPGLARDVDEPPDLADAAGLTE